MSLLLPPPAGWAPLVGLLVLAPLLEEAALRAGLHEALLRRGWLLAWANAATATLFAAAHVMLRGDAWAALVAVPALAIGWLYGRRRRLRECVLLHAAMNGAWLLVAWALAARGAGAA